MTAGQQHLPPQGSFARKSGDTRPFRADAGMQVTAASRGGGQLCPYRDKTFNLERHGYLLLPGRASARAARVYLRAREERDRLPSPPG